MRPPSVLTQPLVLGVYAAATAVLAIGLALFASPGSGDVLLHFAWVAALSIAVTGSLIAIAGVWTTTGVYAAIFWCFHFGLIAVLASRSVSTQDLWDGDDHWILGPFSSVAAVLADGLESEPNTDFGRSGRATHGAPSERDDGGAGLDDNTRDRSRSSSSSCFRSCAALGACAAGSASPIARAFRSAG